jgi:hypothetical protein
MVSHWHLGLVSDIVQISFGFAIFQMPQMFININHLKLQNIKPKNCIPSVCNI